ncbi:AAA family ATPase [Shewanella schlegeliana]|uniref:AAA family ATPase n=1 Tax=Shewanella schlegeliana TaxID=190308 RepID=A0ABS1SZ48_9GAMM|nr:AAA family ATPase [Shewanella schlegeliana]MBL4913829.1 AAA family ATPase [Shewanella schlegeliana]MCL1108787.1 AAA family ATPase [Shewanella schlegeliana]GIU26025.1 ATPase [Shewanella schlegeliana]
MNITREEQSPESIASINTVLPMDTQLAPRPKTISETGVSESVLLDLVTKHLLAAGVLTREQLVNLVGVTGGIIQQLLDTAKSLAWVENRQTTPDGQMRYALSAGGEVHAKQALSRNGYLGLAPVPLKQYANICRKQSSRAKAITFEMLEAGLSALVLPKDLLFKIGPAMNSSRPVLIYGPPGTGKSYLCRHLNLTLGDSVLIPYALAIGNEVIQVYDPELHHKVEGSAENSSLNLSEGHDPRWIKCERPLRITGGELTAEMLEVQFDSHSRTYMAPLQLKANNGILLLDDLGRQKISAKQLFNRWIIPMEERRDFLSLQSGEHFEIPFELILLFSTNLDPKELVDEAFLRRLGYKIHFDALDEELYRKIWFQVCEDLGLSCTEEVFQYLLVEYHKRYDKPLIPCYPRDLLGIMSDQISFMEFEPVVTPSLVDSSWSIYFV